MSILQYFPTTSGNAPTTANSIKRADRVNNELTDDSARGVGNKKRIGIAWKIFGVHTTRPPSIVTPFATFNTNKAVAMAMAT